jgi:hypothetical protein
MVTPIPPLLRLCRICSLVPDMRGAWVPRWVPRICRVGRHHASWADRLSAVSRNTAGATLPDQVATRSGSGGYSVAGAAPTTLRRCIR